jgi:holo-[acyl-carrier protein] synthase
MIQGVGIDVVDIDRFAQSMERTPGLKSRLFTDAEVDRPVSSLAARFAAKEALAKALGVPTGLHWHDCEVSNDESGRPLFLLRGSVAAAVGDATVHLSLSHDAGIASALVIVER